MQLFGRSANSWAKGSLIILGVLAAGAAAAAWRLDRSNYRTGVGVAHEQPVQFSHEHHVRGLGIDCRYCHTGTEESSFAGVPPTKTCMNCHSVVWSDSPMLAPVRRAYESGRPLEWTRVHNLPDYVFFDHSIHVAKGVGCTTCHGSVDRMPLLTQSAPLTMGWCLECHRHPEKFLRPREDVFRTDWRRPQDPALGEKLVQDYRVKRLTACSTCHR